MTSARQENLRIQSVTIMIFEQGMSPTSISFTLFITLSSGRPGKKRKRDFG